MAKLYAELTSDKGGRVASKGGNNEVHLSIRKGNSTVMHIDYSITQGLHVTLEKGHEDTPLNLNGYIVQ